MNCEEARAQLHEFERRRLDDTAHGEVAAHLQRCTGCAAVHRSDQVLDEILVERLPRYPAPDALKRRLAMIASPQPSTTTQGGAEVVPGLQDHRRATHLRPRRWARVLAPALAATVVLASGIALWRGRAPGAGNDALTAEVVNDHLRVLASQHPLDMESSGTHDVKPWFEGKLDFAPDVPLAEGTGLRLRGGAIGYVFDRKAAVVVYALRKHAVTLLVFRPEGLAWPEGGRVSTSYPITGETSARGFNAVWWRAGGLGYALVSDVNGAELAELGARLARDAASRGAR